MLEAGEILGERALMKYQIGVEGTLFTHRDRGNSSIKNHFAKETMLVETIPCTYISFLTRDLNLVLKHIF